VKRFEVHFLATAAADLDELFCHVAKESSLETADRYLTRLERFCLSLSTLPARGTTVPGRVPGVRRMGFERRGIVQRHIGLLAALLVFLCGPCLHAQAPIVEEPNYTPTLTFDVATIRLAPPPDANFHVSVSSPPHSSRFEATNLPIKALLQIAYGFDAPVVGAPDWIANTFYNIQARSDEAADARLAKLTDNEVRLEKRNAIRVLLAERWASRRTLKLAIAPSTTLSWTKAASRCRLCPAPAPRMEKAHRLRRHPPTSRRMDRSMASSSSDRMPPCGPSPAP
jgi:plasmid stabilization system protein ParE